MGEKNPEGLNLLQGHGIFIHNRQGHLIFYHHVNIIEADKSTTTHLRQIDLGAHPQAAGLNLLYQTRESTMNIIVILFQHYDVMIDLVIRFDDKRGDRLAAASPLCSAFLGR